MKRSATSSAGLPLPSSRYRKRDGVGRAEGERERQISRLRPPPLSRVSGSRPQRNPSPLASRGPATPVMRAAAASAPTGGRRTSPEAAIAATRPAPASPGAIGYRFSCLSLGAPGERGLHRPAGAPASISPLTQHRRGSRGATKPSWAGGGGAETTCNGRRGERGCGLGAPANKSPGVVHPPPPPASQVAHSSSGWCPLASRALGTPKSIRKTRHGRGHPRTRGDGAGPLRATRGRPKGTRSSPPLRSPGVAAATPPAADPVTARTPAPRPLPGTPETGARAPPRRPRHPACLGLLPHQIAQMPPAPFKVRGGRVSHQTLSSGNLAPLPDPHFHRSHEERSLYTWDKAN